MEHVEFLDIPITEAEVQMAILHMKTWKSSFIDGFPAEYYKQRREITGSIWRGIFLGIPPPFDKALKSVIPKKNKDTTEPYNYRPISLLNVECPLL